MRILVFQLTSCVDCNGQYNILIAYQSVSCFKPIRLEKKSIRVKLKQNIFAADNSRSLMGFQWCDRISFFEENFGIDINWGSFLLRF